MARGAGTRVTKRKPRRTRPEQTASADVAQTSDDSAPARLSMSAIEEIISGNSRAIWDAPQIRTFMLEAVSEVLERRNLRKRQMVPPKAEIVMPALEVLRYSPLKGELACLIASSMDKRKTEECLPAFVDLLKQITMDEAKLIVSLPGANRAVPSATINYVDQRGQLYKCVRHILPEKLALSCQQPSLISAYVDNLLRLGILTQPDNITISNEQHYKSLTNQPFLRQIVATAPSPVSVDVHRTVVTLSDLGESFRKCCLEV